MKILVISNLYPPDFIGGYEILCGQAVEGLRQRGHDVVVLTAPPRRPVDDPPYVHRNLYLSRVYDFDWLGKVHPMSLIHSEVESNYVSAFNVHVLCKWIHGYQPDVVFPHNLLGLGGLSLIACLKHLSVPWVWNLGDAVPLQLCSQRKLGLPDSESFWGKPIPQLVAEYNRQIRGNYLLCSTRLAHEIEAGGLRMNGTVKVLPNWYTAERAAERTRFFKGGKLHMVCAGALGTHKGTDIVIDAAARLRKLGYDDFVIDSYGKVDSPTWQVTIDSLGLRDHVVLKGPRPHAQLMELFRRYDLFLFPTWSREPFGLVPIESASQGCLPIISRCCGVSEWLVDGVHCLKADRTADAFAEVLVKVLNRSIDIEKLARRACNVVWRDFHRDALMPQVEEVLEDAAAQPRTGAGSAAEAYQLALIAERTALVLAHESLVA